MFLNPIKLVYFHSQYTNLITFSLEADNISFHDMVPTLNSARLYVINMVAMFFVFKRGTKSILYIMVKVNIGQGLFCYFFLSKRTNISDILNKHDVF